MKLFKSIEEMEQFYYGDLNADMIKKADAHTLASATGYWNKVYGAKVWSQMNYEQNAFAAIPKEPWVKTGWRFETARGITIPSGGVAEGHTTLFTAIPDSISPTWALMYAPPKTVAHTFGLTEIAALLSGTDDTISVDELRTQKGKAHAQAISAYLIQDTDTPASNGIESMMRFGSGSAYCADTTYYSAAADPDLYPAGTSFDRSSASTYDAQVDASGSSAAALRDVTIAQVDGVWANITKAGGQPKVFLTGYNTLKSWASLLEAERRFNAMQIATFVPRFGGAAGITPGVETGFSVATYNNVPIIPCQDLDSDIAAARTNEVGPILMLDTDYIRFATLKPTTYLESNLEGDMLTLPGFGFKGVYETIGEVRCYNFATVGLVRDIK